MDELSFSSLDVSSSGNHHRKVGAVVAIVGPLLPGGKTVDVRKLKRRRTRRECILLAVVVSFCNAKSSSPTVRVVLVHVTML
jgi:hypothetical protein